MKWTGSVLVQEKMVFPKQFTGFPDIVHMIQFFCTPLVLRKIQIQIKGSAYTRVHNVVQRKIQTEKGTSAEIKYLRRLEKLFC
jgi:hypothetical protein